MALLLSIQAKNNWKNKDSFKTSLNASYVVNPPPAGNFVGFFEFGLKVQIQSGNAAPVPKKGLPASAFTVTEGSGAQASPAPLLACAESAPGYYRIYCGLTFALGTSTPFTVTVTQGGQTATQNTTVS
jgi:hypothetical protein